MAEDPLDRYRKFAEIHAVMDYADRKSVRKGNSAARAMGKVAAKMLRGGRDGAERFSALLEDSNAHVALWAAHHLLDLGEVDEPTQQRALRIIERASQSNNAGAFGEGIWLQQWRDRMASKVLADRLDHIVLTVNDIEETMKFYERALGLEREFFRGPEGQPRYALRFGNQKINLQDRTTDTVTKAKTPTFGSGDFCLIVTVPLDQVLAHLRAENIPIVAGPVSRRGALGPIRSVYFRDPDGNLVEVAEYVSE